jgi:hypothetical protein
MSSRFSLGGRLMNINPPHGKRFETLKLSKFTSSFLKNELNQSISTLATVTIDQTLAASQVLLFLNARLFIFVYNTLQKYILATMFRPFTGSSSGLYK